VERSKRTLVEVGDYLGSYFMDDRAALVVVVELARRLCRDGRRPRGDVYLVCTTNEEVGGVGAAYAARTLPDGVTLALEVGPAESEYGTTVSSGPIVAYGDAMCVYDRSVADHLMDIADKLGLSPQAAVLGAFESDASHVKAGGLAARSGLLCLPTLSTHGFEVISRDAIPMVTDVLEQFLQEPQVGT
jgi:putative aminopeptidase FrvX